jgi:putative flippase GtrA
LPITLRVPLQFEHFVSIERAFSRFVLVGVVATAAQYLLLVALVDLFGSSAILASAISYAASTLLNYVLNRRFTFSSRQAHGIALPRFLFVAATGLGLNTGIMWLLTAGAGLYYLLAQVFATGIVLVWNFVLNNYWTFRTES